MLFNRGCGRLLRYVRYGAFVYIYNGLRMRCWALSIYIWKHCWKFCACWVLSSDSAVAQIALKCCFIIVGCSFYYFAVLLRLQVDISFRSKILNCHGTSEWTIWSRG